MISIRGKQVTGDVTWVRSRIPTVVYPPPLPKFVNVPRYLGTYGCVKLITTLSPEFVFLYLNNTSTTSKATIFIFARLHLQAQ